MGKAAIKVRKKDVVWNYVGTVVSMGSNFVLLPLLLLFLSSEQIGLWYVFVAIAGFAQLLEFGFTSTLSRSILYCLSGAQSLKKTGVSCESGETNWHLFRVTLKTSRFIYGVIGVVGLVLTSTVGTFYVSSVTGEFSISWSLPAWAIFNLSIFTNLFYLYKLTFLRGIGDVAGENRAKTIARIGQLIITAVLLVCGFELLATAIGYFAYSVLMRMIAGRAFSSDEHISAGIASDSSSIRRSEILEILKSVSFVASRDGVVSVAWYGATQATTLICSVFLGLAETGTYSVMLQLATALYNFGSAYMRSCLPMFQSAFVAGDEETQRKTVEHGISNFVWVYWTGAIAVAICLPLLALFKSDFICSRSLFFGLAGYLFMLNQHSLFCNLIVSMNEIPYFKAYIISTAAGIGFSCLLCGAFGMGVWGLVIGQFMPQLFYNNWRWPCYILRRLGMTYVGTLRVGTRWWAAKLLGRLNHSQHARKDQE